MLDGKRDAAIVIALEARQHRRIDQVAVERIGRQQARRQLIEGQRPEGVDRRKVARREAQLISVRPAQRLPRAVDEIEGIDRLVLRVAVDAKHCAREAGKGVAVEKFARAEPVRAGALARVELRFLVRLEFRPRVGHAVLDGLQHFRGKRFRVECSVRSDPELGEPGHDLRFGRIRRAESEHEIEDAEKLRRGSLRLGAQRLDEVDRGRRRGRRLAEELRQRLDLVPGLDFLDVVDVVGTEKLGPVEDEGKFGLRTTNWSE